MKELPQSSIVANYRVDLLLLGAESAVTTFTVAGAVLVEPAPEAAAAAAVLAPIAAVPTYIVKAASVAATIATAGEGGFVTFCWQNER